MSDPHLGDERLLDDVRRATEAFDPCRAGWSSGWSR